MVMTFDDWLVSVGMTKEALLPISEPQRQSWRDAYNTYVTIGGGKEPWGSTPTTGGTMAATVTQAANGVWWVNDNGQWKMYDPNDPIGSDITLAQLQAYQAQAGTTTPAPTPTPQPTPTPTPTPTTSPDMTAYEQQIAQMQAQLAAQEAQQQQQAIQAALEAQGGLQGFPGEGGFQQPGGVPLPRAEEFYGREAYPEAGWINKLMSAGLYNQNPVGRYLQQQYQPQMNRWLIGQSLAEAQGQEFTPWYNAPAQWGGTDFWSQLQGLEGQAAGEDWMASNPMAVWDIAAGGYGGITSPFSEWLQGQGGRKYNEWLAQSGPGVTSPMSFMDVIRGYMPGR